jgi:6-phosphofructokinase 1
MRIGVLTSGGDAPGMNAAIRAVVRGGLGLGVQMYAVREGLQGLVDGLIEEVDWCAMSGVLQMGGTILGTARSDDFRTIDGRTQAVRNLLLHGIDRLVVIGGDGSLTGATKLQQEWSELSAVLVSQGSVPASTAEKCPHLTLVGLPGSIDNDFCGTDITIGADTALHRIVDAIDAIFSTAASHQRTFVIEVMGRNCGYLALASALATGAEWVLIPECPVKEGWQSRMCAALSKGRAVGRRASIVVVAEGARDTEGKLISSATVRQVLEEELGEDARVTILGHVQRGGSPSAFDRILSTMLGQAAVELAADSERVGQANFVGSHGNRPNVVNLAQAIQRTQDVAKAIDLGNEETAMALRGGSFLELYQSMDTLVQAKPKPPGSGSNSLKIAIIHGGSPAPGMNMAVRAAVRLLLDKGHKAVGVRGGFRGLVSGDLEDLDWMSVSGWSPLGGAKLGTHRDELEGRDLYNIARNLENNEIDGLLMIGGWKGYEAVYRLSQEARNYPAFEIPMVCLPASIDNNLPGSEFSIGADTALNSIIEAVDKIKQSAVAARRVFIVQVMGHHCGYLALLGGLATGAERVYLNEFGITADILVNDLKRLLVDFDGGKRIGLLLRNEKANDLYTTDFMGALFEEEGQGRFDVRKAILGHLQQGGAPTPFDRLQAIRMASHCVDFLHKGEPEAAFLGLSKGSYQIHPMDEFHKLRERDRCRPKKQWWLDLYGRLTSAMSSRPVEDTEE